MQIIFNKNNAVTTREKKQEHEKGQYVQGTKKKKMLRTHAAGVGKKRQLSTKGLLICFLLRKDKSRNIQLTKPKALVNVISRRIINRRS